MSTGLKIQKDDSAYSVTFQIMGWVDLFTRQVYRNIAIASFKFCQANKGLAIFGYVIMSNHIHLLAQAQNNNLSDIIRDFKNFTSQKFLEIIESDRESRSDWMKVVFGYHGKFKNKQTNQIWTHENHPELIFSNNFVAQKLDYIHQNPVRAGLVEKPEDYLYSSARNYAGIEAILDITLLNLKWKTY
jgi:REP element-mobilizing transposase RayT